MLFLSDFIFYSTDCCFIIGSMGFEKHRFRDRLLVMFTVIAVVPIVLLSLLFVFSVHSMFNARIADISEDIMGQLVQNIEEKALDVNEFCSYLIGDTAINDLLHREDISANDFDYGMLSALSKIENQFSYRSIAEDILSLYIIGENGLFIGKAPEAALSDRNLIKTISRELHTDGLWGGLIHNPAVITADDSVVAFRREILDESGTDNIGTILIFLSERFFSDEYEQLLSGEDFSVVIRTGNGLLLSSSGDMYENGSGVSAASENGWHFLLEYRSDLMLDERRAILGGTAVAVIALFMVLVAFAFYLSNQLSMPIRTMVQNLKNIGAGRFCEVDEITNDTEIGDLNCHIIEMGNNIQSLIAAKIAKEKENNTLEFRMLQAQINPHFIYNTLNSISVLARMQGKSNISRMISALGALLRTSLNTRSLIIPLKDELFIAENYMLIYRMRTNGSVGYECSCNADLNTLVPKFLLQPLLENALLHGFISEGRKGKISLDIIDDSNLLRITVKDDGAGISPQRLKEIYSLLDSSEGEINESEHGVGLVNVQRRINLLYGNGYHIRISSAEGNGTVVDVSIPKRRTQQ